MMWCARTINPIEELLWLGTFCLTKRREKKDCKQANNKVLLLCAGIHHQHAVRTAPLWGSNKQYLVFSGF